MLRWWFNPLIGLNFNSVPDKEKSFRFQGVDTNDKIQNQFIMKKRNKRLFFFLMIFLPGFLLAQKGSIAGRLVDPSTGEYIPFASVAVFDPDGPAGGAVSGIDGLFKVENLPLNSYTLKISFIGYETDSVRNVILSRQNPDVNLGTLNLRASAIGLEEVEIAAMAKTVQNRIDRKIYRAEDFQTAAGGNAGDILSKLPAISLDPDGVISLRGTSDILVYLNGKPVQMDASMVLSQLQADNIESVEIITVPGARFDAQGKGGIININTRKGGLEGFSITANLLGGGGPWNNRVDRFSDNRMNDDRYNTGINLSYGKNKLNIYGGVLLSERNINGKRTGDARLLQDDGSYFHMIASGERPEWFRNYSANAGLEFKPSSASSLNLSYFYGKRQEGRSAYYLYQTFFADKNKNPITGVELLEEWIYNPNTDERTGIFHTASADYRVDINDHSSLGLSVLYEHSSLDRLLDNRDYLYSTNLKEAGSPLELYTQADRTPLDGFRISADYSGNLRNGDKYGFGIQPQWLKIAGSFSYDTLGLPSGDWGDYSDLENRIDLGRFLLSAYVDYQGNAGPFKYVAGIRMEQNMQEFGIQNPDYFTLFEREADSLYTLRKLDLFPSLHLVYDINDKTSLAFAANRRISRPPAKNMAPFLYRRHFEVYEVGDPALQPEYMSNAEINLNRKLGRHQIGLTGFYRETDHAIFRVNTVFKEENVLIRSFTNAGDTRAAGLELNSQLEAGKKMKIFIGGSLYRFHVEGNVFGYRENNTSTNWSLKGNMNLLLSPSLKFNADFIVKSATVTSQGEDYLFWMTNAALSYNPKRFKAWEFSLKGLDILGSNQVGLNTRAFNTTGQQIFYQETEYLRAGPIAELLVSYSFNSKSKNGRKAESVFGKEQF